MEGIAGFAAKHPEPELDVRRVTFGDFKTTEFEEIRAADIGMAFFRFPGSGFIGIENVIQQ